MQSYSILILRAPAEREDVILLPLPGSLRGGAATKVIGALLSRGLIAETVTEDRTKANDPLNRIWRNDHDGRAVLLHLTEVGRDAVSVEPPCAPERAVQGDEQAAATESRQGHRNGLHGPTMRPGTKQATLIEMLRSENGVTIAEICDATGWQPHTVRGALAGALKKRLGLEVTSEKVDGCGQVYRLPKA